MSQSFLIAAEAREYHTRRSAAIDADAVTFTLRDADDEEWTDVWINALHGYGEAAASCLPPPPRQEQWHACSQKGDANEAAFRAVEDENVELVRELFSTPKDLLRWRAGEFMCGCVVGFTYHESVLHVAFAALNLETLQILFAASPMLFMALMGMTNAEEWMGEGATLPLLYGISLAFRDAEGGQCSMESQVARRASRLTAIMAWLCDTGLMTPTLAALCFPLAAERDRPQAARQGVKQNTKSRWIIEDVHARAHLDPEALAVLERWEQLSVEEQSTRSLEALTVAQ